MVVSIAVALWYIFGKSPTFEQAILVLVLTILFTLSSKIIKLDIKITNIEHSFIHLAKDFKEHLTI